MTDLPQQNNLTPEAERALRLAEEIRQATGIGLNPAEQKQADEALSRARPRGVVHSMQSDIQDAMKAPTVAPVQQIEKPQISLSDALKDVLNPKKEEVKAEATPEVKPEPKKTEGPTQYREMIEEGVALEVESTPITGMQREQNMFAAPKEAVIHTLKYDVQDLVKKKKVSMIRAVALESDKTANAQTINRPIELNRKQSNVGVYVLSTLFFILGMVAIGAVIYAQGKRAEQEQAESNQLLSQNTIVFYEHQQQFDITDLQPYELKGGLAQLREKLSATLGSFTLVQMTLRPYDVETGQYYTRYATLQDIVNTMKPRLPKQLSAILYPEYMFAVHTTEENTPVIFLVADAYDSAFAGMLAWEPSLAQDLAPFFPNRGATALNANSSKFEDMAVDNIDARVLRAPNKKVRILYAVLEKNVIVITNNIYTLKEAAARLHARTSNMRGTGI